MKHLSIEAAFTFAYQYTEVSTLVFFFLNCNITDLIWQSDVLAAVVTQDIIQILEVSKRKKTSGIKIATTNSYNLLLRRPLIFVLHAFKKQNWFPLKKRVLFYKEFCISFLSTSL